MTDMNKHASIIATAKMLAGELRRTGLSAEQYYDVILRPRFAKEDAQEAKDNARKERIETILAKRAARQQCREKRRMREAAHVPQKRDRDANGWIIPKAGTVAHLIYGLMKEGKILSQIVDAVPDKSRRSVGVVMWRIRHPEEYSRKRSRVRT